MNLTAQGHRHGAESKQARHRDPQHLGSLEDVERAHVQRVLAQSATFEEAADHLGINLTTLWRMRKRWGLC
jgi:transcriptional regulator with PAS, ATPase and Fis domain